MSKKQAPEKLVPRYSGEMSHAFWQRVNALPPSKRDTLYACGVLLQNLEGSVLQWLVNAENSAAARRAARVR